MRSDLIEISSDKEMAWNWPKTRSGYTNKQHCILDTLNIAVAFVHSKTC